MYTDKKSKFITHVLPVDNEEDALEFLKKMRSEYSDATHNVYAYIIDENNIFRYSDDGEPGGTAGMPVLDVMRKDCIVDAAIVVTRYFGGTLLGTGGLVHAYSAAARMGIENAGVVMRTLCSCFAVTVDYDLAGKVQYKIADGGYISEDTVYESRVTFKVCLKKEQVSTFLNEITEITCGRAIIKKENEKYIDI